MEKSELILPAPFAARRLREAVARFNPADRLIHCLQFPFRHSRSPLIFSATARIDSTIM